LATDPNVDRGVEDDWMERDAVARFDARVAAMRPRPDAAPSIALGRNQFDLLTGALNDLLALLVEDWREYAPTAKDPWEGAGRLRAASGTGEVWDAIHHARSVLMASERWEAEQ
jgi:hypothetical protein